MRVKFWGVRGSIPSPLTPKQLSEKVLAILERALVRFAMQSQVDIHEFIKTIPSDLTSTVGGNTSCTEICDENGNLLIIDAGSGICGLGRELLKGPFGQGRGRCKILITHTHWDHIQGLPFFIPLLIPGNHISFISAFADLEERLREQFDSRFFPVQWDKIASKRSFHLIQEKKRYKLGNLILQAWRMNHPGKSYGIKITENDRSMSFTSDAEFNIDVLNKLDQYIDFFRGSEVIVFDSQYTLPDQIKKIDWGNSSGYVGVDVAIKAQSKKLFLWHHDPFYDDKTIKLIGKDTIRYKRLAYKDYPLKIEIAKEGNEFSL